MSADRSIGADHDERVRNAFCELCGLEGGARRNAIAALRASDAAVAAEVESLLGFHDEQGDILDRQPMVEFGANMQQAADPTEPPGPGSLVGGWRLRSALGSGGTLIAFGAARESDGRDAVLMMVRPELLTQAMIDRFDRASSLVWPRGAGIAACLGAGVERPREGSPGPAVAYIAMELVEGVPITRFAQTRCSSGAERLALVERACRAVGEGHAQGVAHSELAPESIHVLEDRRVKVLEFGLSRLIEAPIDPGRKGPTTPGSALLSPGRSRVRALSACAAPEQLGLTPAPPDARMDVFALGIIAFEAMTGLSPPTSGAADLNRLPEAIRPTIARAMSRSAEDRFPTAAAMADALASAAAGLEERGGRGWWSRLTGR